MAAFGLLASCSTGSDASSGGTAAAVTEPPTTAVEQSACYVDLIDSVDRYVESITSGDGAALQAIVFQYGMESAEYKLINRVAVEWIQNAARAGADNASTITRSEIAYFCARPTS